MDENETKKKREYHRYDFSSGVSPDTDKLQADVKLLADSRKEVADERCAMLDKLFAAVLGGRYFGIEVAIKRKYAYVTVKVHSSVQRDLRNVLHLTRVYLKPVDETPKAGITPAPMTIFEEIAVLQRLRIEVEHETKDHPARKRSVFGEERLPLIVEELMRALSLDVKGFANALGVDPTTVYKWLEGKVFGPFFYDRLSALLLIVAASPTMDTKS